MHLSARTFVVGLLIFGVVAAGLGSIGFVGGLVGSAVASGCDSMTATVFGIAGLALASVGFPHLLAALLWLGNPVRSRSKVIALCVFNLIVNAIIAGVLIASGLPGPALIWIGLFALNLAGWRAVRRA